MKKILILSLLILQVNAAPMKDWYVGVGLFGGSGSQSQVTTTSTTNVAYNSGGADMKFGIIFSNNNRFEASAIAIGVKTASGSTGSFRGVDYDWIYTSNLNNKASMFLPFLSVGFGTYTYNDTASLIASTQDITGVSMQAALGFYLQLKNNMDVEISSKSKVIVWGDYDNNSGTSLSENMRNLYLGLKYKF